MQDILVYANDAAPWSAGLTCAARLAANFGASLTGAYICPSPMTMMLAYGTSELLASAIKSAREQEDQQGREAEHGAEGMWARGG